MKQGYGKTDGCRKRALGTGIKRYVAVTRTINALPLISPADAGLRSAFIARLELDATQMRADPALQGNGQCNAGDSAPAAQPRALRAHWDQTRKVFYLKPGHSTEPFAQWLDPRWR